MSKRTKPTRVTTAIRRGEAQRRIAALLAEHPDAHERFSLADIARLAGCSRQNAAARLPGYTEQRRTLLGKKYRQHLTDYLKRHPQATRRDVTAATLNIPQAVLATLWKELGPSARPGPTTPERTAARRAELQRVNNQRILREESCVICGSAFGWTGQKEKRRRLFGAPITCSRSCSIQYFQERRQGLGRRF